MEYKYHIFSPYRVCPLGAHVDHQHGIVTGFAIDKGVDLRFSPNADGRVHLESPTFGGCVDFDVTKASQVREHHWGDYARGVKYALRKRFELRRGITGEVEGSLPVGGLSSSAAVLVAYTMPQMKPQFRHRPEDTGLVSASIPTTVTIATVWAISNLTNCSSRPIKNLL